MVALLSHMRSMSEIIQPHLLDQQSAFEKQFAGMSLIPFTYSDYETTRNQLIQTINFSWTETDKKFLLSFKKGTPDWELFPVSVLKDLPAIKWKLENINKLILKNPKKHKELLNRLNTTLKN
jgi:hypothetical protein